MAGRLTARLMTRRESYLSPFAPCGRYHSEEELGTGKPDRVPNRTVSSPEPSSTSAFLVRKKGKSTSISMLPQTVQVLGLSPSSG